MPEDSKKNDKKNAKEQRKPRQRHQQGKTEKKPEKTEDSSSGPKVPSQKPPVYENPPPEFYKNLKRETDDILKITEEENTKYKKKEIQSNWSKYEVPIESYDEIDEQENLGADYEKLIEAPLAVGGHFQFKHEKSWDLNTGPSLYDKYFDINMEDLNIALCTIPFYERNNIESLSFSETDILTMTHRSTKFKQKYYNDKSYSTPDSEAQDRILSLVMSNESNAPEKSQHGTEITVEKLKLQEEKQSPSADINLESNKKEDTINTIDSNKIIEDNISNIENSSKPDIVVKLDEKSDDIDHDSFIFGKTEKVQDVEKIIESSVVSKPIVATVNEVKKPLSKREDNKPVETRMSAVKPSVVEPPADNKNPVIESPEDLEKWLDDFLDG